MASTTFRCSTWMGGVETRAKGIVKKKASLVLRCPPCTETLKLFRTSRTTSAYHGLPCDAARPRLYSERKKCPVQLRCCLRFDIDIARAGRRASQERMRQTYHLPRLVSSRLAQKFKGVLRTSEGERSLPCKRAHVLNKRHSITAVMRTIFLELQYWINANRMPGTPISSTGCRGHTHGCSAHSVKTFPNLGTALGTNMLVTRFTYLTCAFLMKCLPNLGSFTAVFGCFQYQLFF